MAGALLTYVLLGVSFGVCGFALYMGVNLVPLAVLAGLLYFLTRSGGVPGVKRKFVTLQRAEPLATFSDIGGQTAAKRELSEALRFLTASDRLASLGIRPLKGILLTGPPGTGKTLLAKASAAYTHSTFLAASGSEFVEMYAGVGAQRVRELFARAREAARQSGSESAIVFIDELEVLGGKRGSHSSHLEYDQTLNQLLVEMDGLGHDRDVRVLVIGATNRIDMLDPALTRPGRFDRIVRVDLPDKDGRLQIIKLHTRNKPLSADVDPEVLAKETFGFSGAHLESLANEAAILAFRENQDSIQMCHFLEAVDKVILGEKLDKRPDDEELRRVAMHEIGHAITAEVLNPGTVSTVTISPRGGALGYVRRAPERDSYLMPREKIEEQIAIALGGAVSEEMHYGSRSTGCRADFEDAVSCARRLVLDGMSDMGIVDKQSVSRRAMHEAVTAVLKTQEERVRRILEPYSVKMPQIAAMLVDHERLSGERLRRLVVASPVNLSSE